MSESDAPVAQPDAESDDPGRRLAQRLLGYQRQLREAEAERDVALAERDTLAGRLEAQRSWTPRS